MGKLRHAGSGARRLGLQIGISIYSTLKFILSGQIIFVAAPVMASAHDGIHHPPSMFSIDLPLDPSQPQHLHPAFDKNLSHSLKPSSVLVALRKVKWLGTLFGSQSSKFRLIMLAKVISYVDVQVAKLITVTSWQYRSTTPYCPVHCGITYKTAQQIFEIPPL